MKMSDSLVIIPTYNEKENVVKMLETVMSLEPLFNVLVVDDGSPDSKLKNSLLDQLAIRGSFVKQYPPTPIPGYIKFA